MKLKKTTNKTLPERKQLVKCVCILCAIVLTLSIVLSIVKKWESGYENAAAAADNLKTDPDMIEYNGKQYLPDRNLKTILIIGTDTFGEAVESASYNNNAQADFLSLVIINSQKKSYSVLRIDRDTMCNVNVLGVDGRSAGTANEQIALSHTYGTGLNDSCENTVSAVSSLLCGFDIDYYAAVNMSAVPIINDAVGGVKVKINDDFSKIDSTLKQGKRITLNGQQALTYVRARGNMDDSTNKARMERQWNYIVALAEKTRQVYAEDDNIFMSTYKKVADYFVTNAKAEELNSLMNSLAEYEYSGEAVIPGQEKMGEEYVEFYPDRDELINIAISLLYKQQ